MKRINQYELYQLGHELHALLALGASPTVSETFPPLWGARIWIDRLASGGPIELGFAKPSFKELVARIEHVAKKYYLSKDNTLDPDKPWDVTITNFYISRIKDALTTFEHNLAAELRQAATYIVPRKGAYDTAVLVDSAEEAIDAALHPAAGEKAVAEFNAAGRCYAFGLPTAAGFHVCRAVEAVMEKYYMLFSGKSQTLNGWHDYITELQKILSGTTKPNAKTLYHLEHMKDSSRNPIMHCKANYRCIRVPAAVPRPGRESRACH